MAAAAAAKLLQSCLTLCDPIDGSPPGSAVPGILQATCFKYGLCDRFSISCKITCKSDPTFSSSVNSSQGTIHEAMGGCWETQGKAARAGALGIWSTSEPSGTVQAQSHCESGARPSPHPTLTLWISVGFISLTQTHASFIPKYPR